MGSQVKDMHSTQCDTADEKKTYCQQSMLYEIADMREAALAGKDQELAYILDLAFAHLVAKGKPAHAADKA